MKSRRYRAASLVSLVAVAGWIALSACSNQGEGERCETANLDEDCQAGLVCVPDPDPEDPANTFNPGGHAPVNPPYRGDRCCPRDRSTATHPACVTPTSPITGDSAPPPDTGPVPDATVDAGVDAPTGVDAADDAAADAADAADGA
jgi:hypothetical protein